MRNRFGPLALCLLTVGSAPRRRVPTPPCNCPPTALERRAGAERYASTRSPTRRRWWRAIFPQITSGVEWWPSA